MTSPFKPTKYRGTDVKLTPFVTRNRQPTGADYRQPETGRLYPIGCIWQVGKNPTTGAEGDLFALSKIVANVAFWIQFSGGGIDAILSVTVDASTAPGTNPVLPDANATINVTGGQVATGIIGANVIRTDSLAANTFTIEIQQSSTSAIKDTTLNGVSHYNSAQFTVDEGFVSTNGSGLIVWEIISANQTLEINHGYICVSAGGNLAFSLPATSTLGDIIEITLDGATSFTITQAAGQQIRYNNLETTLGAGGSIATTDQGNTIRMVAQTATRWNILSALGTLVVT